MVFLRKILFPFAVLYGWITQFRNFLFDNNFLKSESYDLPIIAVGNLSVGGTGKSPQIEYLIRLLSNDFKIATLSRGYKRKSNGFVLADENSNAEILGDEPYQFHLKFPKIQVAVDADRRNGITKLLSQNDKPQVILLDDAFQHRKVKAGFYILLTAFGDLYADDFMLPTGNLREGRIGANRADIVVVTKCPPNLSESEQRKIRAKLKLSAKQKLYFTSIQYDENVYSENTSKSVNEVNKVTKVLAAGIAKPKPFFEFLKNDADNILEFPDHHDFSESDISTIKSLAKDKIIITTEKDYVRLKGSIPEEQLFYLPIRSAFISVAENFDKTIKKYVGKSSANR